MRNLPEVTENNNRELPETGQPVSGISQMSLSKEESILRGLRTTVEEQLHYSDKVMM
jgi:hypothetical protein